MDDTPQNQLGLAARPSAAQLVDEIATPDTAGVSSPADPSEPPTVRRPDEEAVPRPPSSTPTPTSSSTPTPTPTSSSTPTPTPSQVVPTAAGVRRPPDGAKTPGTLGLHGSAMTLVGLPPAVANDPGPIAVSVSMLDAAAAELTAAVEAPNAVSTVAPVETGDAAGRSAPLELGGPEVVGVAAAVRPVATDASPRELAPPPPAAAAHPPESLASRPSARVPSAPPGHRPGAVYAIVGGAALLLGVVGTVAVALALSPRAGEHAAVAGAAPPAGLATASPALSAAPLMASPGSPGPLENAAEPSVTDAPAAAPTGAIAEAPPPQEALRREPPPRSHEGASRAAAASSRALGPARVRPPQPVRHEIFNLPP